MAGSGLRTSYTAYRPVLSAIVDSSQVVAPPTLQLPSVNNVVKVASSLAAPEAELKARNNTRVSSGAGIRGIPITGYLIYIL